MMLQKMENMQNLMDDLMQDFQAIQKKIPS